MLGSHMFGVFNTGNVFVRAQKSFFFPSLSLYSLAGEFVYIDFKFIYTELNTVRQISGFLDSLYYTSKAIVI